MQNVDSSVESCSIRAAFSKTYLIYGLWSITFTVNVTQNFNKLLILKKKSSSPIICYIYCKLSFQTIIYLFKKKTDENDKKFPTLLNKLNSY